jgi:uroporphyrinogen III methyltransferase/synthase
VGACAYAGIPLTHRDHSASVTLVTGQEGQGKDGSAIDWRSLARANATLVFYMGITTLRRNMERLMEQGRDPQTPVALIRWGTTPHQLVLSGTLADIADLAAQTGFKPPAVTVVGEVVALRETLQWFDKRPLFGCRVLVTRAADQAGEFAAMLAEQGAIAIECPTIRLVEPEQWEPLDRALRTAGKYDWLVLTSGNAVRAVFQRLETLGLDTRVFGSCRVCVVGPKTAAALREFGIRPDLVATDYKAEGVVAEFGRMNLAGARVLFPRGDLARDLIPRELERMGARVDSPVAYRTTLPDSLPREALLALEQRAVDCVTFTSSSTVTNLAAMLGNDRMRDLLKDVAVASIGPITTRTCQSLGLTVTIEPAKYTLADLTAAIEVFFSR